MGRSQGLSKVTQDAWCLTTWQKQKARVKWLKGEDTNTVFFHGVNKDRTKKLNIQKIRDGDGQWVDGTKDVAKATVKFFEQLFSAEDISGDCEVLNVVKKVVTEEDNAVLTASTLQEVKESVFSIYPNSTPGPDGLNERFYQTAWPIIAKDIYEAGMAFFLGATLPKFFTHTCLDMLPKLNLLNAIQILVPISLCNVSSRIIARC
uniref:Uncharacterized protein n=1 Tax=Nicotiana tabacum TaxID=4097 RepID=A0A1S3ZY86_TOBAC|nr:PREDICTED: uncharacterized protein LOC107791712 [Nicotiana tabacum]